MKRKATFRRGREWPLFFLAAWIFFAQPVSAQTSPAPDLADGKHVVLTDAERAWVHNHPIVYWGADPSWPPFSSFDAHGNCSGIDYDLVNLIAKRTGLRLKLVRTQSWPETWDRVTSGELDFVSGIVRTVEREREGNLLFTDPYCTFPTAIVTRKGMAFLTTLDDLRMRSIALPRDYASTQALEMSHPHAHFVITGTEEQSMQMVADNKADATVVNVASASYIVHMDGLGGLKISGFTDVNFFLRLGVRKDDAELYSILSKGLATVDKEEVELIYARYIAPETRREIYWKTWRDRAIYTMLISGAAVASLLLWNRRLASEIRRRKTAEAGLLSARDDLQARASELDHQASEMRLLNEKLTRANQELSSFSYSVSHDLKSPLRRMRNFVDLLREDASFCLNDEALEHLARIQNEAHRMQDLIEALLVFARIGSVQMHPARVDLDALMREVIQDVQAETKDRPIVWHIHPLVAMQCDKGLMRRAIANLIDNAVKFTRGRTPAVIETGVREGHPDDPEVVFYVKDNGAGFDMSYAGGLFQTFQRLHSQEEFEGSGIGLANVRRIIQRHGGRVWAEGGVDKGATFFFTLPRQPVQAEPPD